MRRDLLLHHLPSTTNFELLLQALSLLLASEHHQVLVSTLTLLYRYVALELGSVRDE